MSPAPGYRPIGDYGLISDTHSCALVSSEGSIDWACFPRFDSGSVFGRLLDAEKGGHFTIRPPGEFESSRRYLPGTNVLETTFQTPGGVAVLTDFMPVHGHSKPAHPQEIFPCQGIGRILHCSSGAVEFEVTCQPRFEYGSIVPHAMLISPHTGYAHGGACALAFFSSFPLEAVDNAFRGAGTLQAGESAYFAVTYTYPTGHEVESLCDEEDILITVSVGDTIVFDRLVSSSSRSTVPHAFTIAGMGIDIPFNPGDRQEPYELLLDQVGTFTVTDSLNPTQSGTVTIVVEAVGAVAPTTWTVERFVVEDARFELRVGAEAKWGYDIGQTVKSDEEGLRRRLEETKRFWLAWSQQLNYDGPHRDEVLRSALTLKALTYSPTGGLVAAPTCSLPEVMGGERNWDYRFTWIRDTAFALYALNIVGFTEEARAFKGWLERATAGRARDLQVMYGLGGERRLTEVVLDHLEGYRGSRPVRIGNGAYRQLQLDIYGEILDSAHLYRRYVGGFDLEYWDFLKRVAQFVMDHWREPDEGIWETRGGPQQFVFSKVMCWVALDRAVRAVDATDCSGPVEEWRRVREEIRQEVMEKGFDPQLGTFVQSYGSKALDASLLMLPLVKFIKATDPRMRATIEKIATELTSPQGLVYRYAGFNDGLEGSEGAFTICTFWMVDNLLLLGEIEGAAALLERLRGYANDLGLFSEEIDPDSGEMLGNFPQAFSHMAFINAAVQLQKALARQAKGK